MPLPEMASNVSLRKYTLSLKYFVISTGAKKTGD